MKLKIQRAYFFLAIWILRRLNRKATHSFWYSPEQASKCIGRPVFVITRYKGRIYSECRSFSTGVCHNYDDMKLLGVGTYSDIEVNGESVFSVKINSPGGEHISYAKDKDSGRR